MKTLDLSYIHFMARALPYDEFEQTLKVEMTGQPSTTVINCNLVMVDWADVKDLEWLVKDLNEKLTKDQPEF